MSAMWFNRRMLAHNVDRYIMTLFILGIIVGLLLSLTVIVVSLRAQTRINRRINQLQSTMKIKGSIMEPESEELDEWVNEITPDES